ncbi:MAG: hypothetical protein LBS97_04815 [Treponema sp.]|jgi:hypothetical protein|nr:hypothetical protein [Treponema sp.]
MKKLVTGFCLTVLVLFMASIFARFFTWNVLIEKLHMNNTFTRLVFFDNPLFNNEPSANINWAKLYPFETAAQRQTGQNTLKAITARITGIEEKIEIYTKDNLINRMPFVEIAVRSEKAVGWNLHDTVIDLDDGFITETVSRADVLPLAESLADFRDFLQSQNIGLLYVQSPHKICRYDTIISIPDFANQNADEFLAALSARHIPHLDLRETLHQQSGDYSAAYHHSLFYRTDHHWKAETGLWAAGVLAGYFNGHYGFSIDTGIFTPERYRYEVYKNWFLGSMGKKVTLEWAKPEDISLIYPKADSDISLRIPSKNIDTRGSFEVIYDYRQVENKNYYGLNPYGAYRYTDNPVTVIQNHLLHDGKKILIINDSFVTTAGPFVSLGIEQVEMLDLRHFTGSVRSYIEQSQPDVVVVMYYPSVFPKKIDYTAHTSMFDFR